MEFQKLAKLGSAGSKDGEREARSCFKPPMCHGDNGKVRPWGEWKSTWNYWGYLGNVGMLEKEHGILWCYTGIMEKKMDYLGVYRDNITNGNYYIIIGHIEVYGDNVTYIGIMGKNMKTTTL